MDKKKDKFEVGDKVRVTYSGRCYPYHSAMFKRMGFKDKKFNGSAPRGTIGTIFYMVQEESEIFIGIDYGEGKQPLIKVEVISNNK